MSSSPLSAYKNAPILLTEKNKLTPETKQRLKEMKSVKNIIILGGEGIISNKVFLELKAMKFNVERSEEHTSELQSRQYLVCRLLLEKKKKLNKNPTKLHSTPLSNIIVFTTITLTITYMFHFPDFTNSHISRLPQMLNDTSLCPSLLS